MRTYRSSAVTPKEPLDFDEQRVVEMLVALKRTDPSQRLDTLVVVVKALVEGHLNE